VTLRARLRQENGFALVMALATMVVFAIATTTVVTFTTANQHAADHFNRADSAGALAEAALNNAYNVLNYWDPVTRLNNASDPTLLGCDASGQNCHPLTYSFPPHGSAGAYGVLTTAGGKTFWTITATGTMKDESTGVNTTKTAVATVDIGTNNSTPNVSVWNYVLSTAPPGPGCEVDLNGTNVIVDVPLYVTGDLCMSGTNTKIVEDPTSGQKVDVVVVGKVVISGTNAKVGESASQPITRGVSGQGCTNVITGTPHACSATDRWYVANPETLQTVTPPSADFSITGAYASASPGPTKGCDPSTPAPALPNSTWDNNLAADASLTTTFNLTPATSYNCITKNASGATVGQLSWDAVTGTLTILGQVYIDGNVSATSSVAMYAGKASLYVNGSFSLTGTSADLRARCGGPGTYHQCSYTEWDPNANMLLIAANGSGNAQNFSGTNNEFQGSLFCNPTATASFAGTNVKIEGPVICGRYSWGTNTSLKPLPSITSLPIGAPVQPNAHAVPGPLVLQSSNG
jgi:type II secretory pathway pseudopilin PulG